MCDEKDYSPNFYLPADGLFCFRIGRTKTYSIRAFTKNC
nr:MAG TPA: hypothetical protein [Caudoviricetes sp.]